MADSDIHKPQLPGVKTLAHDSSSLTDDENSIMGISFLNKDGGKMTNPKPIAPSTMYANERHSDGKELFNVARAIDDTSIETGTIVTDRRHTKHSWKDTFQSAFDEWWGKTSRSLEKIERRIPKKEAPATVEKPDARKDVIIEASQHTRQVPRDDHTIVIEKLKTLAHDAERVTGRPYIIKKPTETRTEGTWSSKENSNQTSAKKSDTDSVRRETPDLRTVAIAPKVAHHPDYRTAPSPTHKNPKSEPAPLAVPHIDSDTRKQHGLLTPKDAVIHIAPTIEDAPKNTRWNALKETVSHTHIVEKSSPPVPSVPTPMPQSTIVEAEPAPEIIDVPPTPPKESPRENVAPTDGVAHTSLRTAFPLFVIVGILILGSVAGIVAGVFVLKGHHEEQGNTTVSAPLIPNTFFTTDVSVPIILSDSRTTLMQSLVDATNGADAPISHFYFVFDNTAPNNSTLPTAVEVADALGLQLEGRFLRSLDETIMFGSVHTTKNEPFIVMRSPVFETAFAGMLAWEPYMKDDLAPFFDTLQESVSTTTLLRPTLFTDALRDNQMIRILYDETGRERIMYAFITHDTMVITTSSLALSAILSRF